MPNTGTLDMAKLCAEAGLSQPEFRESAGQFIQILGRPKPTGTPRATGLAEVESQLESPTQSSDPVERLLRVLEHGERSSGDLREAVGVKHRPTFRDNYLHPALSARLIEYTIPDKPNSRLQKYRLTKKGREWLATRKRPGNK